MDLKEAVAILDEAVPNPNAGLPDDVFYFVSRMTPLINVDLLIKDSRGRVLLSWRDDEYTPTGWHIPGGIIRFKETMGERVQKVAHREIGIDVSFDPIPIAINEMIQWKQASRSHFISLLINCRVPDDFEPDNKGRTHTDPGYLLWHQAVPVNLIDCHGVYARYF